MRKTEIFQDILNTVCHVTEISPQEILSEDRREEVVDARAILAQLLNENGFYIGEIAAYMKRTRPSIRYLLKSFEGRSKTRKMIQINIGDVQEHLKE